MARQGGKCALGLVQFWVNAIIEKMMMFWFFSDYHFHTKQLPLWWSAFRHSLVPSHHPCRRTSRFAMSPICFFDTSEVETWNHDNAAGYAGVQLVRRHLCLENYSCMDKAICVDADPQLSQFNESTQLIDWFVFGATRSQTLFSNSCSKINWS